MDECVNMCCTHTIEYYSALKNKGLLKYEVTDEMWNYTKWCLQKDTICMVLLTWGSSVQSLSRVQLFANPWIAAHQASLSITNSCSSLKLMSIESVMPSSHLTLCRPLLLPPNCSQDQSLFQWVNSLHEVAKVLEFQLQHQSFQRTPRTDLL